MEYAAFHGEDNINHGPYGQGGQICGFVTKSPCISVVILLKARKLFKD
jgi:hypothetical protein